MSLTGASQVQVASPPASTPNEGAAGLAAPELAGLGGEFDARVVAARVRANADGIKRCYERELARNPTLGGELRIEFTILTDGSVVNLRASVNTISSVVEACVIDVLASMRFSPRPTGGSVRYRFPFLFDPGH
jgi:TonB family protein